MNLNQVCTLLKVTFKTGFLFTCFYIEILYIRRTKTQVVAERAHLLRDNYRGERTGGTDTLHLSVLSSAPCSVRTLLTSYNLLTGQDHKHSLKIKPNKSSKITFSYPIVHEKKCFHLRCLVKKTRVTFCTIQELFCYIWEWGRRTEQLPDLCIASPSASLCTYSGTIGWE